MYYESIRYATTTRKQQSQIILKCYNWDMQVEIYNVPKDVPIQTISLGHNTYNTYKTLLFHCFYCGQAITQIQGTVTKVFPGLEPTDDVVVINKCQQCKRYYTFQSHKYKDTNTTRVVLSKEEGLINTFHCYICRNPLLQFNEEHIYVLPDLKPLTCPQFVTCFKSDCKRRYHIIDIL